jgi:8-oxo-dGTP diphosphatase
VTSSPPEPGDARRQFGPRDPGDAWVVDSSGERYWGRFGAAGVLVLDPLRGVLLQHRVSWSHFGGTWALPGGARHEGESARAGALREAREEAGVPESAVRARLESVLDLDIWSYTTVVADVVTPFEPTISDPESIGLEWVPVAEVADRPLHPAFADSWPALRELLPVRPAMIVDAANVVGSVPDGWWRDRAGAARRLVERVARLADGGVPAALLGLGAHAWFPDVSVVLEGQAKAARDRDGVVVVRAPASGDDAIVAEAERLVAGGRTVTVITSDRALRERVDAVGARSVGARALTDLMR